MQIILLLLILITGCSKKGKEFTTPGCSFKEYSHYFTDIHGFYRSCVYDQVMCDGKILYCDPFEASKEEKDDSVTKMVFINGERRSCFNPDILPVDRCK